MIRIDLEHQAHVRQQFQANYLLLKSKMATLHAKNVQISIELSTLLKEGIALHAKWTAVYNR